MIGRQPDIVAAGAEERRDRRILSLHAFGSALQADFGEAGAAQERYVFHSGIGYGWKQWVADGFYAAPGLDEAEKTIESLRSVYPGRITHEDNARSYLIWAGQPTAVKYIPGTVLGQCAIAGVGVNRPGRKTLPGFHSGARERVGERCVCDPTTAGLLRNSRQRKNPGVIEP